MASAVVLSAASFVRVLLTPGATTVATLAVSVAMGATVIGAVMFGTTAPIVLHGMGVSGGGGGQDRWLLFGGHVSVVLGLGLQRGWACLSLLLSALFYAVNSDVLRGGGGGGDAFVWRVVVVFTGGGLADVMRASRKLGRLKTCTVVSLSQHTRDWVFRFP